MTLVRNILLIITVALVVHQSTLKAQIINDLTITSMDTIEYSIDSLLANNDSVFASDTIITSDFIIQIADSSQNEVLNYLFKMDSMDVYSHSFFPDSVNYFHWQYMDTSNHKVGEYNPVKLLPYSYNDLGNIGSAQENQVFKPSESEGFSVGIKSYDAYLWRPKDLKLYKTRTPYTDIFYLMGSKKENSLKFSHAQSFVDQQVTINFDFQLFSRIGAYNRQKTDVKGFTGGVGYRTKNSRYQANFQYYHNKLVLQENGGITDLAEFEESQESNRQIISTNLAAAENLIRISGGAFQQSFYLSKPEPDFSNISDTNRIDFEAYSVTHFKKPYFEPVSHLGKISHYFNYERQNYRYTDQDQDASIYDGLPFYPNPDSSSFFDTIGMQKYINEFIYSNSDYKDDLNNPKFINFFAGGRHELVNYYQHCQKQEFNHLAVIGGAFLNFTKFMSISADASYYIGDYLNNDFQFDAKLFLKYKANLLSGGIKIIHRSPDWMMQEFSSSRFKWDNDFDKTDIQKLFVKFERKRLNIEAQVMNLTNLVYLDSTILPTQSSKNIQHIVISAQKDIRIGHWGTNLRLTYQNVSHPEMIRVPEFSGKAKLFYHNILFEGALELEMGVEAYFFTKYYANKYMPALRAFHIQNEQEIGDYPFVDVYLNAKIGKARIFVRYDHLNSSFMGGDYYASPSYPAADASFKFGVSWILFN